MKKKEALLKNAKDLTTEDRKEMPSSEFGVPKEKRFPMPDKNHARLALSMINKAKGLSEDQKANIRSKAHAKLGD